jgi:hypothetical protein
VIPLSDDIGALRQTLSYLDMDGESARTEVVLSVARSELWSSVEQGVQDAATDLSLVLVTTGEALSVGGAARVGLQAAAAERVILVSDAIAPPSRGWISSVLEDLAASEFAAPDSLPRFDGLPHRFEPRSPGRDASIWSHESVTDSLAELGRRLGLDRRSPGLVAARRRALLDADIAWGEAINGPAFWAGLLNEALRRNASSLRSGGLFTYAPVSGPAVADDELLDTYALEQRLRGALSPVEPSAEPS